MKKIQDIMASKFPIASGSLSVRSALSLMREQGVEAVAVMDDGALRGIATYLDLSGCHPNRLLYDVRLQPPVVADPLMSLAAAYDLVDGKHVSHLPVIEGDRLVGIASVSAIQSNLGISTDPLTGFPWANSLRERAIAYLAQGQEIAVLFMDIDQFGQFNKVYGHVIGDRVIASVAQAIQECLDPVQDYACRYAGDEFAIVSTRRFTEAEALGQQIQDRVSRIHVDGVPEPIGISVGIRGGRRTQEREGIHYAATVDDLINLASKASTLAKAYAAEEPMPSVVESIPVAMESAPPVDAAHSIPLARSNGHSDLGAETPPRPVIAGFKVRSSGTRAEVEVKLLRGGVIRTGIAIGTSNSQAVLRLVAEATLQAANSLLPDGYYLLLDAIQNVRISDERSVVVSVVGLSSPEGIRSLTGAAMVQQDIYRTAVESTLHAINRFICRPSLAKYPIRQVIES